MADTWDKGAAGVLLSDMPPLIDADQAKADEAPRPPAQQKRAKDARTLRPAADKPVARVVVDLPLAHLDRPFDYLVPERLAEQARPGVRVRIMFAGQRCDGYLLERAEASEHQRGLRYLTKVVSAEQVLTEEIAGLARAVADRYAGTLADVLRLAVPPRHAATETAAANKRTANRQTANRQTANKGTADRQTANKGTADGQTADTGTPDTGTAKKAAGHGGPRDDDGAGRLPRPDPGPWSRYPAGRPFLDALAAGRPARAAWTALPGAAWPEEIARAAVTAASVGRGVVIVVPDARDLARVDEALAALVPAPPPAAAAPAAPAPPGSPASGSPASGLPASEAPAAPEAPGQAGYVTLTADLGPAERYRRWLAALRGEALIVAGTRAAMFAPVRDLGLVVLWDDGDDLHAEPRAPYPNAREVLALRAHRAGAAALIGGFGRTTEMTQLVKAGWARDLRPDRPTVRAAAPRVRPASDEAELGRDEAAMTARLPALALRTAREALAVGPVLVQVPRRGYLAGIACARCRAQARCTRPTGAAQAQSNVETRCDAETRCNGPLRLTGPHAAPDCRWCGALATSGADTGRGGWRCPACGHDKLRATITGATRTAEELGRAFPGVKVRTSGGDLVLPRVPAHPALVIATPGAEPLADYAAALLLDGWALLSRPSLRAGEEALRRWLGAAALVRPGGTVLVHADAALPATQALIRWDPVTFAERDLAERAELGFPPAVRMAAVSGEPAAVAAIIASLDNAFEVLGPVPADQPAQPARPEDGQDRQDRQDGRDGRDGQDSQVRALVRAPRTRGAALARALAAAQAGRSARKEGGGVRVQLDPAELI